MAEGTRDYKRLESMLKECEQKRENDLAKVEGRVNAALEEIKTLINGMTLQHNEIRNQMNNQEGRSNRGQFWAVWWRLQERLLQMDSTIILSDTQTRWNFQSLEQFFKVDEWIFKVEQFFVLDRTLEQSKIQVVSLHLEGGALHWNKKYLKMKGRMPSWEEYVDALKKRFGPLAYEDPMADMKKLKQNGPLQDYLKAFDRLMDKAQLSESRL